MYMWARKDSMFSKGFNICLYIYTHIDIIIVILYILFVLLTLPVWLFSQWYSLCTCKNLIINDCLKTDSWEIKKNVQPQNEIHENLEEVIKILWTHNDEKQSCVYKVKAGQVNVWNWQSSKFVRGVSSQI